MRWKKEKEQRRFPARETGRRSDSGHQLDACLRDKVKLQRAYGGCLGDERR
jgi:hypothetical protein